MKDKLKKHMYLMYKQLNIKSPFAQTRLSLTYKKYEFLRHLRHLLSSY